LITLDFETEAIIGNPVVNPPLPVGVAVWVDGQAPSYLTGVEMIKAVNQAYNSNEPLLFHNAQFDLSVARKWLHLPLPPWQRIHDTMFLLFLKNPYGELSLKPAANEYLGMLPEEQDDLRGWILMNVEGATAKNWGAFISKAPPMLVAPYAIGDVVRTRKLFTFLEDQQGQAYDRERRLLPILNRSSVKGIRIARPLLTSTLEQCSAALDAADCRVRTKLGAPALNVSSNVELARALDFAGALSHRVYTAKGNARVSKDVLAETVQDPEILNLLLYRNAMQTCLGFLTSWEEKSRADGRVHTEWNQVRSYERGHSAGTRTGRLSAANPNFQNVPTEYPVAAPPGLIALPYLRVLYLPEDGHVWLKRDFSSQEIRITAHYEDGTLLEAYRGNPALDPHQFAMDVMLRLTGTLYARKRVKIVAFSIVYGSGIKGLSEQMKCSYAEADAMRNAYFRAFPGIKDLIKDVTRLGKGGLPIKTWGGRTYYAEPGWEYKLLNYLIQGSAADQTKEALCDWDDHRSAEDIFLATVHDELNISVLERYKERGMEVLRISMDKDRLDVPMRSEGFWGYNWHDLHAC
jgi:DNA polymerase-1